MKGTEQGESCCIRAKHVAGFRWCSCACCAHTLFLRYTPLVFHTMRCAVGGVAQGIFGFFLAVSGVCGGRFSPQQLSSLTDGKCCAGTGTIAWLLSIAFQPCVSYCDSSSRVVRCCTGGYVADRTRRDIVCRFAGVVALGGCLLPAADANANCQGVQCFCSVKLSHLAHIQLYVSGCNMSRNCCAYLRCRCDCMHRGCSTASSIPAALFSALHIDSRYGILCLALALWGVAEGNDSVVDAIFDGQHTHRYACPIKARGALLSISIFFAHCAPQLLTQVPALKS